MAPRWDLYQGPRALGRRVHRHGFNQRQIDGVLRAAGLPRARLGADHSFRHPTDDECAEFLWNMVYLSTDTRKLFPQERAERLVDRGGGVGFVYQDGKADILLGAPKGKAQVAEADRQLRARNLRWYEDDVPTRFACDTPVTVAQRKVAEQFVTALCGWSTRAKVSLYGPDYFLDWCHDLGPHPAGEQSAELDADWECVAWSGGRRSRWARALQLAGAPNAGYPGGCPIDENLQVGNRGPFAVHRKTLILPQPSNRAVGIAAAP